MGAKRHVKRNASGGKPKRDRGMGREHYLTGGSVAWPTMADGTQWSAALKRVTHVDRPPEEAGSIRTPELEDGAWVAVVDWDAVGRFDPVSARVPLDNLLPQ